jgi:hypothetical protein
MAFTDGGQLVRAGDLYALAAERGGDTTSYSILRRPTATEGSMVSSPWLGTSGTRTAAGVIDMGPGR